MGTTADKIAKAILAQERSGVIDLSSYRAGKAAVEDARLGDDRLRELLTKGYDPAHAAFIYAQNCASFLSERMSAMKELRQFAGVVGKAEDEISTELSACEPRHEELFHDVGAFRRAVRTEPRNHWNLHSARLARHAFSGLARGRDRRDAEVTHGLL